MPFYIPQCSKQDIDYHDRMVGLVDRMHEINGKMVCAKAQEEKRAFQREYDMTDKQIDRLVYKLYGLTDDEIRIVEESISGAQ